MSFSKLGLAPSVCTSLTQMGYAQPTPVQSAAIPLVLEGADVLARAETGTGKTAAFGLPMIDRLLVQRRPSQHRGPIGLVLVPTRELATQVHRALAKYGAAQRLRVTSVFGGMPMSAQIRALRQGPHIVVATPGRLLDHMERRTIDLSAVEILTLDEGDRMLDMGFLPPLRRILKVLPQSRQTLMFSATMTPAVVALAGEFTRDAKYVDVVKGDVIAPTITHRIHPVNLDRKRALLVHVLTQAPVGQALVFCKTKRGADKVVQHLEQSGLEAAVIHGNKGQGARTRALADFKAGRVSVLVATDIAARGLDIVQLPLVVNFDLPLVAEDYIHRVGRTGRAGAAGRAISLVSAGERDLLSGIQRLLAVPLERVAVEGFESTGPSSERTPQRPNRNMHSRPRQQSRSRFAGAGRGQARASSFASR
jgi:ATP-dependent RNA helicase RhlE